MIQGQFDPFQKLPETSGKISGYGSVSFHVHTQKITSYHIFYNFRTNFFASQTFTALPSASPGLIFIKWVQSSKYFFQLETSKFLLRLCSPFPFLMILMSYSWTSFTLCVYEGMGGTFQQKLSSYINILQAAILPCHIHWFSLLS